MKYFIGWWCFAVIFQTVLLKLHFLYPNIFVPYYQYNKRTLQTCHLHFWNITDTFQKKLSITTKSTITQELSHHIINNITHIMPMNNQSPVK